MNREYKEYSAIEFVDDAFFKQWVCEDNAEAHRFWTAFLARHPEKRIAVEEARKALGVIRDLPARSVTAAMMGQAEEMRKNIDEAIHYPFLHADNLPIKPVAQEHASFATPLVRLSIAAVLLVGIISLLVLGVPKFREDGPIETHTVVQTSPKGKRSLINLPDGSKVWLNAESQLIYSKDFENRKTREVFLVGEGFFEVTEDTSKPFIVSTLAIAIKVLGTSFNVRSYEKDKTVETTLVKGKVAISMINGEGYNSNQEETALLPNQRAVFIKKSKKLVLQNNVEAEVYSGWRKGKLYFDDKPITEVLAIMERWYNITIHLENIPSERCTFSAKIDNKTLVEVLELFKTSAEDSIEYTIKDKDVFITGKLCR